MVIKKRQLLWDWTNTKGPGNPGVPDKINQVSFGPNSPVASVVNWNSWVPPELRGRVPFRPMVRVLASTQGNDWNMIRDSKENIILFFNEPERSGISPEKAKDLWYSHMLPLRKKGKKLGSPAVASDDQGRKWMDKFMSLVAKDPPDYLCLHYYAKTANTAIQYIENMHKKWPHPKVMVTEIACIDRNHSAVLHFTVQVCNWMDSKDWIFEYGLFDFQRKVADGFVSPAAQLMDANGNFTQLGKMYCTQQPMRLPSGARLAGGEGDAEAGVKEGAEGEEVVEPIPERTVEAAPEGFAPEEDKEGEAKEEVKATEEPAKEETKEETKETEQAGEESAHDPMMLTPGQDGNPDEAEKQADKEAAEQQHSAARTAGLSGDQQKALDMHNSKRKAKGLKPLAWDANLAAQATKYAQHLAKLSKMQHSTGDQRPNQGENLAAGSALGGNPLERGTKMWLDEEKNYHGQKIGEGNFGSYGHYSE
jgi:uncharacterized protein YkwD